MSDQEDEIENNEEVEEEEQDENGAEEETPKQNDDEGAGEEGEEEEKPAEEEEEKPPDVPLSEKTLSEALLLLCKTGNGLSHAYVRLDASGKELTDILLLKNYIHLRYIDLSNNNLKDISSLSGLTHLLTLKLDLNKLTSLKLDVFPYLQQASFSDNKIKTIEVNCLPKLEQLNLNNNEISSLVDIRADRFPNLESLEIRGNKLTTTRGMNLPKLKQLYIAANSIVRIEDFNNLSNLNTLHIRDNKLENLDGFNENLKSLQYVNLRGNLINDYAQVKKLHQLIKLRALVLAESPLAENEDYRLEVLIAVRRLERLDKDPFNEDERTEAEEIFEQRRQKEIEDAANGNSNTVPEGVENGEEGGENQE